MKEKTPTASNKWSMPPKYAQKPNQNQPTSNYQKANVAAASNKKETAKSRVQISKQIGAVGDQLRKQNTKPESTTAQLSANIEVNKGMQMLTSEMIESLEKVKTESMESNEATFEVAKKNFYKMKEMKEIEEEWISKFIEVKEEINKKEHPNIVQTRGVFIDKQKKTVSILTDQFPNNLNECILSNKMNNIEKSFAIYQIAEGMKFIHSKQIIHFSLNPSNIFVCQNCQVKIGGISDWLIKKKEGQAICMNDKLASLYFTAPEIIRNEEMNEKIDVYSFGVIVYFILNSGKLPEFSVREMIMNKKFPIQQSFTENVKEIIEFCCNENPEARPSFNEIVEYLKNEKCVLMELTKSEQEEYQRLIKDHQNLIKE